MLSLHNVLAVVIMAVVTYILRALPFVAFRSRQVPKYIEYLGKYLPYAVMAMLVVYCLKGIDILSGNHGIPEIIATAAVVLLHIWKRNTVISVVAGTVLYMILIRIM